MTIARNRRRIAGLPQPRAANARTVRKVVLLEPAEARAQVAAAKRAGKTWSDWIRWLARMELGTETRGALDDSGWVRVPGAKECDSCTKPTRWHHEATGRNRCETCPRAEPESAPALTPTHEFRMRTVTECDERAQDAADAAARRRGEPAGR